MLRSAGGGRERLQRLRDCLRRAERPASGPRGRERVFAEGGAGGGHGVLQRHLVFLTRYRNPSRSRCALAALNNLVARSACPAAATIPTASITSVTTRVPG